MGKSHAASVQHSSVEPNWRTPPELFGVLNDEFHFLIDVAADLESRLCAAHFGPGSLLLEDGLSRPWHEIRIWDRLPSLFMNPPYCRGNKNLGVLAMPIAPWLERASEASRHGLTVVGIIPHNIQTVWFRRWVEGVDKGGSWMGHAADQVRMIPHRVSFLYPDGTQAANAGVNHCVVVWRPNPGWVGQWSPSRRYWDYE